VKHSTNFIEKLVHKLLHRMHCRTLTNEVCLGNAFTLLKHFVMKSLIQKKAQAPWHEKARWYDTQKTTPQKPVDYDFLWEEMPN